MASTIRILSAGDVVEIDEVGFVLPHTQPGVAILPPPATTPDGYVLTAKKGVPGLMDWEAGGGGSLATLSDVDLTSPADNDVLTYVAGTGKWENLPAGAGSGALLSASVTLQDTDLLHLLGTPVTLVTPSAGKAILPMAIWSVADYTHGAYSLADAINDSGNAQIFGVTSALEYSLGPQVADVQPPAASFFGPSALSNMVQQATAEAFQVQAASTNSDEWTGGGSGNTLTITLYYIEVPTS